MKPNPLESLLAAQRLVILDGGLATTLEAAGHALGSALWSARLLRDDPDAVVAAHLGYLEAGADVITTASYQATFAGFAAAGVGEGEAEVLLRRSVDLALRAKRAFWSDERNRAGRAEPLVAASVGPYGAFLADGSEYRGRYTVTRRALAEFHRRRLHLLADTDADVIAIETVPSLVEAEVLAELLDEVPHAWAWLTFSCGDSTHIRDGSPIRDAVRAVHDAPNLTGVGVNCTAPRHVAGLTREVRSATARPIVVYPNSGESYDGASRRWVGQAAGDDWVGAARAWVEQGARVIGGCCRVGPRTIRALREELLAKGEAGSWRAR